MTDNDDWAETEIVSDDSYLDALKRATTGIAIDQRGRRRITVFLKTKPDNPVGPHAVRILSDTGEMVGGTCFGKINWPK